MFICSASSRHLDDEKFPRADRLGQRPRMSLVSGLCRSLPFRHHQSRRVMRCKFYIRAYKVHSDIETRPCPFFVSPHFPSFLLAICDRLSFRLFSGWCPSQSSFPPCVERHIPCTVRHEVRCVPCSFYGSRLVSEAQVLWSDRLRLTKRRGCHCSEVSAHVCCHVFCLSMLIHRYRI